MDLWGNYKNDIDSEKNIYLKDPSKGLELISKLLSKKEKNVDRRKKINKLDRLLDEKLLGSISNMNLYNELEYYNKLIKLSNKILEQKKVKLLCDKTVVGIGGRFSSGKSKFINSILDDDILPEDQNPSTSIATYIIYSNENSIRAYTFDNEDIELNIEETKALNHAFYKEYKFGFSAFINNLVVKNSNISYKSVSILDTPGYNKFDSNTKEMVTDRQKAYDQLKSVDFLIWLIDIENGVIDSTDIEFIRSLDMQNPVLIVINKADKKSEREVRDIMKSVIDTLDNTDIKVYGVTAYSSFYAEEFFKKTLIDDFLNIADKYNYGKENIRAQINNIIESLEMQFDYIKDKAIKERNYLGNIIFHSEDVSEIITLTELYSDALEKIKNINICEEEFKKTKSRIFKTIDDIVG
ncbi:dynamin family protein [Clostridium tyrobutyricum]|uniref:dynamin family protein n=1 Tax=Clostridium tyrobutyricum TaxID=1519 RepID=UPI0011C941F0|nr:dynamin family protein [Clostridium tyrobutyricum]